MRKCGFEEIDGWPRERTIARRHGSKDEVRERWTDARVLAEVSSSKGFTYKPCFVLRYLTAEK